jgi:hypothetical protein
VVVLVVKTIVERVQVAVVLVVIAQVLELLVVGERQSPQLVAQVVFHLR